MGRQGNSKFGGICQGPDTGALLPPLSRWERNTQPREGTHPKSPSQSLDPELPGAKAPTLGVGVTVGVMSLLSPLSRLPREAQ